MSTKFRKRSSDKENPHQRTKGGHPVVQRKNTINNQESHSDLLLLEFSFLDLSMELERAMYNVLQRGSLKLQDFLTSEDTAE